MRKISFRQLIYTIVLLVVIVFLFATCSKQLINPFVSRNLEKQDSIVFQKEQEERIRLNLEKLLNVLN